MFYKVKQKYYSKTQPVSFWSHKFCEHSFPFENGYPPLQPISMTHLQVINALELFSRGGQPQVLICLEISVAKSSSTRSLSTFFFHFLYLSPSPLFYCLWFQQQSFGKHFLLAEWGQEFLKWDSNQPEKTKMEIFQKNQQKWKFF